MDPKTKRQAAPKPAAPAPVAQQPAPVAVAEVAPGVSTGSVSGQAGGVVGGVDGGLVGGVVGGTGSHPVPVGQVANPPRVVHRVAPTYPDAARRRGITGLVVLEAILDREGHVEAGIKVLQSIPMLNEEAIAAVRQWRFSPARNRNGEAVRVILEIPIRFTLRS
jgi:protein TonB